MMNENILFQAKVIQADRYRTLRPYRYGLYFTIILLIAALYRASNGYSGESYPSLVESFNINSRLVFGVLIATIIGAIVLYVYSRQYECLGALTISEKSIGLVIDTQEQEYEYQEIQDLEIIRGATFHYEYKKNNYLIKTNNWLLFQKEDQHFKYEFLIDSYEQNDHFEQMIQHLKRKRVKFIYRSI